MREYIGYQLWGTTADRFNSVKSYDWCCQFVTFLEGALIRQRIYIGNTDARRISFIPFGEDRNVGNVRRQMRPWNFDISLFFRSLEKTLSKLEATGFPRIIIEVLGPLDAKEFQRPRILGSTAVNDVESLCVHFFIYLFTYRFTL